MLTFETLVDETRGMYEQFKFKLDIINSNEAK